MSCVLRLTRDKNLLAEIQSAGLSGNVPSRSTDGCSVNVAVSEASFTDLSRQIRDAVDFLKKHQAILKSLNAQGSLDFGIARRDVAAQTNHFPSDLLGLVSELELGLDVSIYEVSSEEAT